MKNIRKILLISIVLFLLSACGANEDKVKAVNSETEKITEVVSDRSIVISEINGNVTVTHNDGEKFNAYEGMNLFDGDDVVVAESSNVTLNIDTDKHLFADENTHFWLTATGSEDSSKTLIRLESGSVLCDIKEKLDDDESFDIQTASSTMCVRGTVFRVCLLNGKDNSVFDLVEVYDGKVWSNIDNTEESVTLEPGQCALIRKNDSNNEQASYVLEEDLNEKFIEETGLNISLENATDGEVGALKISLENVPLNTLSRLETIIEEGTELAVDKEELEKVKEVKEQEKANETLNENHEHKYVEQSRIASTCVTPGSVSYTCSICGDKKTESLPLVGHTPTTIKGHSATCTEDGETEGEVCSVCGAVLQSQKTIRATGHKDVLDADGVTHKCSICGTVLSTSDDSPNGKVSSYKILQFIENSLPQSDSKNASYSCDYDTKNDKIVFDFRIKASVAALNDEDTILVTYNPVNVTVEYAFSPSELSNENPNFGTPTFFCLEDNIEDNGSNEKIVLRLADGLDTIYNNCGIHKNIAYFVGEHVADKYIDEDNLPNDFSTIDGITFKPLDGGDGNTYIIDLHLSARAKFIGFNVTNAGLTNIATMPIGFTVQIQYDPKTSGWNKEQDWDVRMYYLQHKSNSSIALTMNTLFSPSFISTPFVDRIKSYATSQISH